MKLDRRSAGWAVKAWVIATVFVLPFLDQLEVAGWLVLGAVIGIVWKVLPEGAEPPPPEKLPYHDQYAHKQVPRKEK